MLIKCAREVDRVPNERLQEELADKLEQVPQEAADLVMNMLLLNVSAMLSGVEIGKSTANRPQ